MIPLSLGQILFVSLVRMFSFAIDAMEGIMEGDMIYTPFKI
jgi:hypothetical protein